MRVSLEGASIALLGRVVGRPRAAVERALAAHGAELAPAPRAGVDIALVGSRPSVHKLDRARILGCVLVEGRDIHALLDQGWVELDAPQEGEAAPDDLIAEARGALAQAPSAACWARIVDLVDACDPDRLDALLTYLSPQLERWPRTAPAHDTVWYEAAVGPEPLTGQHLRVMPRAWLLDMMGGRAHPKHRLAHAVDLSCARISDRESHKLLAHAHPWILALRVGEVKSRTFYAALARTDALEQLEVLELSGRVRPDVLAPLTRADPSALPRLRALDPGAGTAAFEGPWGARVVEVSIRDPAQYQWVTEHGGALERLVTRSPRKASNAKKLSKSIQRAIAPFTRAVFSEGAEPWGNATLSALIRRPPQLTELDVSRCAGFHARDHARVAKLKAELPGLTVVRGLAARDLE